MTMKRHEIGISRRVPIEQLFCHAWFSVLSVHLREFAMIVVSMLTFNGQVCNSDLSICAAAC